MATASRTFERSLAEGLLVGEQPIGCRLDRGESDDDGVEFLPEPGGVGLEVGDHARVEELTLVAFERAAALDEHRREAAGALA